MIHRALQAPTLKIAALIQESIVHEFDSVREPKASQSRWYLDTWTGEHGIVLAGYVDTADANGTESRW